MKNLIFCLLFSLSAFAGASQEISREEILPVFAALDSENWADAFKLTNALIGKYPGDSSDYRCIANYASMLSAAGMTANSQMTFKDLDTHLKKFIGKRLMMASHPSTADTLKHVFNTNFVSCKADTCQVYITSSNQKAVNILFFEYLTLADPVDPQKCEGRKTRCSGILKSYELNPKESTIWIGRLRLTNGSIREVK